MATAPFVRHAHTAGTMGRGVDTSRGQTHLQAHLRTKRRLPLILLPVIVISCLSALAFVVYIFQSTLPPSPHRLIPSSLEELSDAAEFIATVARERPLGLAFTFGLAYLCKQTFSLPGSVVLNLFAGIAFGRVKGTLLTVVLTAMGASGAYLLSYEFGHHLIHRWRALEQKILPLKLRIGAARKRRTLIFYLTALRMTTVFPQWLLNLASPHLAVPLFSHFFPATLIGTLPYNSVTVSAGAATREWILSNREASASGGKRQPVSLQWSDIMGTKAVLLMLAMAAVVALPGLLMKRLEARMGLTSADAQAQAAATGATSAGALVSGDSPSEATKRSTTPTSPDDDLRDAESTINGHHGHSNDDAVPAKRAVVSSTGRSLAS